MGTDSKIEWTESTWNPVVGCTKVSAGCQNCYAEKMAYRLACMGQEKYQEVLHQRTRLVDEDAGHWNGKTICDEPTLQKPLHWKKPRRIFVCSMGDLFHETVPFEFIEKVMAVIAVCPQHTFQVLTKRPERMRKFIRPIIDHLPNVWLGVTIESPNYWRRAKLLQKIPTAVKFLSLEPLITDLGDLDLRDIEWVIVGCESGPKQRECKIEWVQSIADQCKQAGVPVFIKQLNINNKAVKDINQFPEDLRFREYPKAR